MVKINNIDNLKFSIFAPLERETSIVEVIYENKILLDFSFIDDYPSDDIEILFHNDINGCRFTKNFFNTIIDKGIEKLKSTV